MTVTELRKMPLEKLLEVLEKCYLSWWMKKPTRKNLEDIEKVKRVIIEKYGQ